MAERISSDQNDQPGPELEGQAATRSFSRRTFLKASGAAAAAPAGLGLFGPTPRALAKVVDHALGVSAAGAGALPAISLGGAAVRPPSVPLAVRSPYFSTWLPATELAGNTAQFWPGNNRGLNGLVNIDGTTYAWAGQPQLNGTAIPTLTQTALEVTATRSIFTANAGGVELVAEFLSPIEPDDLRRESVPFTLLTVSVSATDRASHSVQVYADITGEWVSVTETDLIQWNTVTSSTNRYWTVELQNQTPLTETAQMANWGNAVLGGSATAGQSYQSGSADDVWAQFAANGALANTVDSNFRAINSDQPVFAIAYDLGAVDGPESSPAWSASFAIGFVQTPVLSYGPDATPILPWWSTYWSDWTGAADFFLADASGARERATALDVRIQGASIYAAGEGYSAATALAARQCYGGHVIGISPDGGPWLLGKEISSGGDVNTVDIWDQAYLMWLYLDPNLIPLEMEPILTWCASDNWQDSSLWTSLWSDTSLQWAAAKTRYCIHDIGSYPNATGRAPGTDETMPVEECAGMLIMAASYARRVGAEVAKPFLTQWQLLWSQWAALLLTQVPSPDHQITTDDWAPEPTAGSNLAIKAIIGLAAAAQIATILGDDTDAAAWSGAAQDNVAPWVQLSLDPSGNFLDTQQGVAGAWTTIYNAFYEVVIGEQLVPENIKALEAGFYLTQLEPYGLPLQTGFTLSKTAWNFYIPAWLRDYEIATALYNRDEQYINDTPSLVPYGDRYDTATGIEVAGIQAHPTLGAVFAGLFAKTPPVATTVSPLSLQVEEDASSDVTVTNTNVGDQKLTASWTVTPPAGSGITVTPASGSAQLAPGASDTTKLTVTVAPSAAPGQVTIPVAVSAVVGGNDVLVPGSYIQVTVPSPVSTTISPLQAVLAQGASGNVTLTNTNVGRLALQANWTVTPPAGSGITVTPASGSAQLAPGASQSTTLTIAVNSSAAAGLTTIPVTVTAVIDGSEVAVPGSEIEVNVAFPSLAAAFNNVGITDTSGYVQSSTPGNFDGFRNSYSSEALAAATAPGGGTIAIVPGGQVTSQGLTFTWPDVAAGTADNVAAASQLIELSGSGSTIGFLGSAVNTPASDVVSGSATITYTDGTTDQITIELVNWIATGPVGGTVSLVATCNSGGFNGAGDNPGPGRPNRFPSLFVSTATIDPSKTLATIELPAGPAVGSTAAALHIFAIATATT